MSFLIQLRGLDDHDKSGAWIDLDAASDLAAALKRRATFAESYKRPVRIVALIVAAESKLAA